LDKIQNLDLIEVNEFWVDASMMTTSALFQAALEKYVERHDPKDIKLFQQSTLEDVVQAIARVEQQHAAKSWSRRIGVCLMPLLTFVEQYSKAVDVFVQVSSAGLSPAGLIWGLLRIVLEVS
jgi:hypothetical protein